MNIRARTGPRACRFVRELLPKLAAWHEYLYRERTRDDGALLEVWHPWETGMDNSPIERMKGSRSRPSSSSPRLARMEAVIRAAPPLPDRERELR